MDDSNERRGLPAAHVRFSQQDAILAAVALLSRSYEVLLGTPAGALVNSQMVRLACETVATAMASGQAQALHYVRPDSSEVIRDI